MWIKSLDKELLEDLLRQSICSFLAFGKSKEILWASDSFQEWSGYTESELKKIGWERLSVEDENLAADLVAAESLIRGDISSYRIEKKYIPKNKKPQWGILSVKRIPEKGEFQFCWCHWEPLSEDYSTAFDVACKHIQNNTDRFEEMSKSLKTLTDQTPEQRWINSTIQMMMDRPKMALAIIVGGLMMFGANNTLEFLQRIGIISLPTVRVSEPKEVGANLPEKVDETIVYQYVP